MSWVSTSNCALQYDMALSQHDMKNLNATGWQFGMILTPEHVWDAFIIWTLLHGHIKHDLLLQVSNIGLQKD
ncbi:hypothetical protein DXG01_005775 [Tephrocybe rancida]|nr:hypothetical protein DXG01_005775 [Tephrocybe rancida]